MKRVWCSCCIYYFLSYVVLINHKLIIVPPAEEMPRPGLAWRYRWLLLLASIAVSLYLLIEYFNSITVYCVLYVNGKRKRTFGEANKDCTSIEPPYAYNIHTKEVRTETHYEVKYVIGSVACLVAFFGILAFCIMPRNRDNYRTCYRRTTCCCKPVTLREGIHRYMNGYISDERRFEAVIESCQEDLHKIVNKLTDEIPGIEFNMLTTGSLEERLGKPTFIKLGEAGNLPMKSVLSSDFDVMLTPENVLGTRMEDDTHPTMLNVINDGVKPGFVWLRLNQDYQESRNPFWKKLCNEYYLPDGTKELFLSSFKVRDVFMKGMKKVKRAWVGNCLIDWYLKRKDKGFIFDFKAQGPAVNVRIQERGRMFRFASENFRPIIFYGDFIFAIQCTGWPEEAQQWPLRHPRHWPPPALVQEVLDYGYHVVPKPSTPFLNKKKKKIVGPVLQDDGWRLSFSWAELILSKQIPPVARACALALKATMRRYRLEFSGCVSSYHLKTVLYWALEENPLDFWCEERIEQCFIKLVDNLLQCATTRWCSHYFMPQVNLMATIPERYFASLSTFLTKIKENPVKYVSSSNLRCMSNLAALYECLYYDHGDDFYMDIY